MTTNAAIGSQAGYQLLASAVAYLHTGLVGVFVFGWLLPWELVHWAVILGGIGMQLSWMLLDGNCPLTLLERHFARAATAADPDDADDEQFFVTRLVSAVLNRPVSDRVGNVLTYAVLYASMLICIVRLAT